MQEEPLVSIIIPTYNRAHLIGETLDSVLAQTYTNWECIVVDDGSTDGTDVVMQKYCEKDFRFKYYHRPEEHLPGGNGARNFGFKMSKGEYIQWFDSDDLMLENFLIVKMENIYDKKFIITSYIKSDENLRPISKEILRLKNNIFKDYVLWNLRILLPSICFKKSFLYNFNLFNENILRGQETEFFSRIFYRVDDKEFTIINAQTFLYRQHAKTKSYENKTYKPSFKFSKIKILLQNFERSIILQDKELIDYFFKKLINLFFKTYYNKDWNNYSFMLKKLPSLIKKIDRRIAWKLRLFGFIQRVTKRSSFKIEQFFKNYKLS